MSTIKTNTLTGTTTAGSISVTGEGNSTTTNLQQGLAKHWILLNGTSTIAVTDSFNNTSITDNGTGDYTVTIANNMNNVTFSVTTGGAYDEDGSAQGRQGPASLEKTTTSFDLHCASNTTTADDWESPTAQTLGDLA
jgi:hypothetical protein